jgi:hypothetical protein
MNCPKCNSENVVMVGELAHCQNCENYYKPYIAKIEEAAARSDSNIKLLAWNFTLAAGLVAGAGVLVLLVAFYHVISGDSAGYGYVVAGVFESFALWLFLIAQVIHIRANTER